MINSILDRYLVRTIILATLLVIFILSCVMLLMLILGELKSVGKGDYDLVQFFFYIILRLPAEIYQFAPLLILLGSMLGLSLLSSHSELGMMRLSGFTIKRLMWVVFFTTSLLALILGCIGEGIAPKLSYLAAMQKENAKNAGQALVTSAGVWFHIGNNFIHVKQIINRSLLEEVIRYQFDEKNQLKEVYFAKRLTANNKKEWLLHDVARTIIQSDKIMTTHHKTLAWDLKFNQLLEIGGFEHTEMTLPRLKKYADYLSQNELQATEYYYQFWKRLLQPLASVLLVFLGIPFVLSTVKTNVLGWRMMIGVCIGFIFFVFNALLAQLAIVLQVSAFYAALLPLAICFILAIIFNMKLIAY